MWIWDYGLLIIFPRILIGNFCERWKLLFLVFLKFIKKYTKLPKNILNSNKNKFFIGFPHYHSFSKIRLANSRNPPKINIYYCRTIKTALSQSKFHNQFQLQTTCFIVSLIKSIFELSLIGWDFFSRLHVIQIGKTPWK